MSDNSSTNDLSGTDVSVFNVASHPVGQKFINSLRRNFTGNGNEQRGDFHMGRSRVLFQMSISMIDPSDRDRILVMLTEARKAKSGLNNPSDLGVRRYLKALEYRRLAKEAYKMVVKVSNRVVDEDIMDEILEASRSTVFAAPIEVAIAEVHRVEMETYQSEVTTEESAVVVGMNRQDAAIKELIANLSRADDNADGGVTHDISDDYGDWIFSPYSDGEEESEEESEEELSSEE